MQSYKIGGARGGHSYSSSVLAVTLIYGIFLSTPHHYMRTMRICVTGSCGISIQHQEHVYTYINICRSISGLTTSRRVTYSVISLGFAACRVQSQKTLCETPRVGKNLRICSRGVAKSLASVQTRLQGHGTCSAPACVHRGPPVSSAYEAVPSCRCLASSRSHRTSC